jgi:hypothetical protein
MVRRVAGRADANRASVAAMAFLRTNREQFCVYRAPDPETLGSHGERVGAHRIDDIWEIAGDVTPADFPAAH